MSDRVREGHGKDFYFLITQIELVLYADLPFLTQGKTGYEPRVSPHNHPHISHANKTLTEAVIWAVKIFLDNKHDFMWWLTKEDFGTHM